MWKLLARKTRWEIKIRVLEVNAEAFSVETACAKNHMVNKKKAKILEKKLEAYSVEIACAKNLMENKNKSFRGECRSIFCGNCMRQKTDGK